MCVWTTSSGKQLLPCLSPDLSAPPLSSQSTCQSVSLSCAAHLDVVRVSCSVVVFCVHMHVGFGCGVSATIVLLSLKLWLKVCLSFRRRGALSSKCFYRIPFVIYMVAQGQSIWFYFCDFWVMLLSLVAKDFQMTPVSPLLKDVSS